MHIHVKKTLLCVYVQTFVAYNAPYSINFFFLSVSFMPEQKALQTNEYSAHSLALENIDSVLAILVKMSYGNSGTAEEATCRTTSGFFGVSFCSSPHSSLSCAPSAGSSTELLSLFSPVLTSLPFRVRGRRFVPPFLPIECFCQFVVEICPVFWEDLGGRGQKRMIVFDLNRRWCCIRPRACCCM